jgi:hypothetical protein
MKNCLLIIFLLFFTVSLKAQKDSLSSSGVVAQREFIRETPSANVSIYPVPVRENSLTIKSDRGISFIKITNIIGQDIYRVQYNNPEQLVKVLLDNPKRGIYLVTILFSDGTRTVKKIMVEESD